MFSHIRLFATPWTVASQAPLSMEFSRQEHWNGLPFSTLRGIFPTQGSNFPSLAYPALAVRFFTTSAAGIAASGPDYITSVKRKEQKIAYLSNTKHF